MSCTLLTAASAELGKGVLIDFDVDALREWKMLYEPVNEARPKSRLFAHEGPVKAICPCSGAASKGSSCHIVEDRSA
jgi:hypothetical protein